MGDLTQALSGGLAALNPWAFVLVVFMGLFAWWFRSMTSGVFTSGVEALKSGVEALSTFSTSMQALTKEMNQLAKNIDRSPTPDQFQALTEALKENSESIERNIESLEEYRSGNGTIGTHIAAVSQRLDELPESILKAFAETYPASARRLEQENDKRNGAVQ